MGKDIYDYYKNPSVNEIRKQICNQENKNCEECPNHLCPNNYLYSGELVKKEAGKVFGTAHGKNDATMIH